jgi:hypothetical protein
MCTALLETGRGNGYASRAKVALPALIMQVRVETLSAREREVPRFRVVTLNGTRPDELESWDARALLVKDNERAHENAYKDTDNFLVTVWRSIKHST